MNDTILRRIFFFPMAAIMLSWCAWLAHPPAAAADTAMASNRALPADTACVDGMAIVEAASFADRVAACVGAHRAIGFLTIQGLKPRRPIRVAVVDALPSVAGAPLFGLFDPASKKVKILSSRALNSGTGKPDFFGAALDFDIHASFTAHEVTHAILDQHADRYPLDRASHEYLAYAVQYATLPKASLAPILDGIDADGFDEVDQVTELYLAFAPDRFGVNAFLHFRRATDHGSVLDHLVLKSRRHAGGWE